MKSYVYLHGFASSPASMKARFFADKLAQHGITLQIPELDGGDFERLTLSRQLVTIRESVHDGPLVLIGSSLGGYLAALYAEKHAEVERLVLLAPAFDLQARWAARMGADAIARWKASGHCPVYHYGSQAERLLNYEFFEDAGQYSPYPPVRQPSLVIQGANDDVVLPELAREFCNRNPAATLELFESGHELTNVMEEFWPRAERFLFHE